MAATYPFELKDVAMTTATHTRLQACGACMCHRQHALFVPFLWSFSYQVYGEGTTPSQDEPPLICSPPEKRARRLRLEEHDVTPHKAVDEIRGAQRCPQTHAYGRRKQPILFFMYTCNGESGRHIPAAVFSFKEQWRWRTMRLAKKAVDEAKLVFYQVQ